MDLIVPSEPTDLIAVGFYLPLRTKQPGFGSGLQLAKSPPRRADPRVHNRARQGWAGQARPHSTEAARVLGSPLTTVTMDRSGIADTFPDLIRAAEGPVLDTSCAALLRLAQSVHQQGYKVALTGEGADEALAGYVWYKSQRKNPPFHYPTRWSGPFWIRSQAAHEQHRRPTPSTPPRARHRRCSARPARPLRADLPGKAGLVFDRYVAAAG